MVSPEPVPERRRRRIWPFGVGIVLGLFLLTAGWVAVTGLMAAREARSLAASLTDLQAAATALDITQTAQLLPTARESAHRLTQLTSGAPWWLAEQLPKVGSSVRSGRELAATIDDLLSASEPLQPALNAVASGQLRTADGGIDLSLITGSIAGLRATALAIPQATDRLGQIDTTTLPPEVARAVSEVRLQLPTLVPLLAGAADTAEHIPSLLGADAPRTWLVLLQNPSEARGSGGFIGGYALITADHGKLTLTHAGANNELVVHQPLDYTSLPQDTQDLWGRDLAEWQSITLSPHFPYTGQMAVQGMKQMEQKVDGVLAVDPHVVALILKATGPVTVAQRTVTADSAADYVTRQVYVDNPDDAKKDQALLSLLTQSLQQLTSGSLDLKTLASGFGPLVEGHHLQAYSTTAAEQAWLETTPAAGVIDEAPGPHMTIALNNGAGNKVDAYIHTTASYTAGDCDQTATQFSTATLTLENRAPTSGLPGMVTVRNDDPNATAGGERMLVGVYGPVGALLMEATLDGKLEPVGGGTDRGHPVWTFEMSIDPGQKSTLSLGFTEPTVANPNPTLRLPAMVIPPRLSTSLQGCQP